MLAKVLTGAVVGLDGPPVEVKVDIAPGGMPNFLLVGLPDASVQEARERVGATIWNSGLAFPKRRRYLFAYSVVDLPAIQALAEHLLALALDQGLTSLED
jgi:predicted ATPase with chaperone activity